MLIALAVASTWFYRHRTPALTQKDSILLADFVNTTGDAVFDGTLKQALAVQLEQSPYLNVLPESRIREALQFMGRSPDERITTDVAREICVREGIKAMLTGSISSLGSHYVIDLSAVNAQNGDSFAREQVEAESKEQVLKSLDQAASNLRGKLGESLSSIQKFATPLEQATTSSLEALKAFSLGEAAHLKQDDEAAVPHLKHAIELDPNFAMAYATLGVVYGNLTQQNLSEENLKKAFDLKARASERERFYISAHYYGDDVEKTIEIYEQWNKTYPRDTIPLDNLSGVYQNTGLFEKGLASASEAMRLDPKDAYAYQNVAFAYEGMNRFEEAKAILDKAEAQNITLLLGGEFTRYELAFLHNDEASMQRVLDGTKGRATEAIALLIRAQGEYFYGKVKDARQTLIESARVAQRLGLREFAASLSVRQHSIEAEMGDSAGAGQAISQATGVTNDKDTRTAAAVLLARTGDASGSEKLASNLAREYPNDTILNSVWIPLARASTELHRNNAVKAIELLEATRPYELGSGPNATSYWPNYVRGEAFLKVHDSAKAAAEYQRILDHRGVDPTNPLYTLARIGLARAYALQGDTTKARTAYQDFLALWKDADPNIPILQQAKTEYAKLQ
jgi:eukaryotic-like serine/threonine-protein kinase